MPPKPSILETDALTHQLRERSLKKYPGAALKRSFPGHLDLVAKDKTFAFLSAPGKPFSISVKLPESREEALELPNAQPTRYGLGKRGWVTVAGEPAPPLAVLEAWVEESFRAHAPKTLVAEFEAASAGKKPAPRSAASRKVTPKKAPAKKPAPKKAAAKAPRKRRASLIEKTCGVEAERPGRTSTRPGRRDDQRAHSEATPP